MCSQLLIFRAFWPTLQCIVLTTIRFQLKMLVDIKYVSFIIFQFKKWNNNFIYIYIYIFGPCPVKPSFFCIVLHIQKNRRNSFLFYNLTYIWNFFFDLICVFWLFRYYFSSFFFVPEVSTIWSFNCEMNIKVKKIQ